MELNLDAEQARELLTLTAWTDAELYKVTKLCEWLAEFHRGNDLLHGYYVHRYEDFKRMRQHRNMYALSPKS